MASEDICDILTEFCNEWSVIIKTFHDHHDAFPNIPYIYLLTLCKHTHAYME